MHKTINSRSSISLSVKVVDFLSYLFIFLSFVGVSWTVTLWTKFLHCSVHTKVGKVAAGQLFLTFFSVPANKLLFAGRVSANKLFFAGRVPANKWLFDEGFRQISCCLPEGFFF
jgi:hypothetical protein